MKVVIVKYNAGNIQSVKYALNRLGIVPEVTDDPELIKSADRVIFPGVGEASSAIRYIRDKNLDQVIKELKAPFLGICLGMQLMCSYSEENDTECIGIFKEKVKKFLSTEKIPHMGWNSIHNLRSKLFANINNDDQFYFVHSYFVDTGVNTIGECSYSTNFSAAMNKDNFYGCQFHPEKSGDIGELVLKNFITMEI